MLRVSEQSFRTDTGRQRTANEDSLYARAPLFAVADGMGGAQAGEVAFLDDDGARMPATYANFLIINDAVLVPTYHDPADAIALARLGSCFPGREIIGIDCLPLIQQHGSLHCVTMQLPTGVLE